MARPKQKDFPIIDPSELVDTEEAARILGLSPFTLVAWRMNNTPGLPYYRVGRRIRYWIKDLHYYISSLRITPGCYR